jgi:hypothetical protein
VRRPRAREMNPDGVDDRQGQLLVLAAGLRDYKALIIALQQRMRISCHPVYPVHQQVVSTVNGHVDTYIVTLASLHHQIMKDLNCMNKPIQFWRDACNQMGSQYEAIANKVKGQILLHQPLSALEEPSEEPNEEPPSKRQNTEEAPRSARGAAVEEAEHPGGAEVERGAPVEEAEHPGGAEVILSDGGSSSSQFIQENTPPAADPLEAQSPDPVAAMMLVQATPQMQGCPPPPAPTPIEQPPIDELQDGTLPSVHPAP